MIYFDYNDSEFDFVYVADLPIVVWTIYILCCCYKPLTGVVFSEIGIRLLLCVYLKFT